ncbi:hypothetical protein [Xenorhabdus hominickii]|uniref:Uncharacterized protein n=1 Tax=Xenorhabdus hominickii TaxID=351679 RepID=A0A1V0M441_XENHO|nr:hypothetical protein [Xenorhabdus hominickii]ARD69636.1 hypothetical protein [Xenorhabdus hominickii]PHM52350.1 hypothetical protein Xhom_04427 [Xenorhabdus hominickii]
MSERTGSIKIAIIEKIAEDLKIDLGDLNNVWTNQPILMMKYGAKMSDAERTVSEEKRRIDGLSSTLYNVVRSERSMNGTKTSESALESIISQIERHYSGEDSTLNLNNTFIQNLPEKVVPIARTLAAARRNYDHNKELYEIYKSAVEALRHRRDMVVQASKKVILDYEYLNAGTFAGKK